MKSWTRRLVRMGCVGLLLGGVGCGAGAAEPVASSSAGAEQGSGGESASPGELDSRYREAATHMLRDVVWDGPMAGLAENALTTLRAYSQSRGNPETYLSLEIVSNDWLVSRDRQTGLVTGRHVDGIAVARFPDGHCAMYAASFVQEALGDDFSDELSTRGTGGGFPVERSTVDAIASARATVAR